MNRFKFDHGSKSVSSNQENLVNCYDLTHDHIYPHPPFPPTRPHPYNDSTPFLGSDSDGDCFYNREKGDFSSAVFKFISEILMEEDLESKPCMLQNSLALQAAEKSFYDVLGQKYPPSPNHLSPCFDQNVESSVDSNSSYTTANNLVDSHLISDQPEFESSHIQTSLFDPPVNTLLEPELYDKIQNLQQFKGGIGEASKFLPHEAAYAETDWRYYSSNGSRGRKNHQREDGDYLEEGRSNKHSATEYQQLDMLDEVFLYKSRNDPIYEAARKRASEKLQQNGQLKGFDGRSTRVNKLVGNEGEVMDLCILLTQCAQAVSSSNQTTASELLIQIRQHSSPFGDGTQRLAHYFANALEVRLAGTDTPLYTPVVSPKTSATDFLKGYLLYVSICPFRRMSNFFTNRTIAKLAEKETSIHIIDFGILYGFQWPCLIQHLSKRPGGPPKIRITGIEFPQPGFKPAERAEETGQRLKRYCERFNVPFEYNAIAQKWDTIRLEDLKIDREEMIVVTCLYQLRNLPDDTMVSSPRDDVLRLIKRINPDLFVHGAINGAFDAPIFFTRFRETLFFFSALFDMLEANVPREDEDRLLFERETLGTEVMNVIACEGLERIVRPETYKQWQGRDLRIGFRQLPLDQGILRRVKKIVKSEYHDDFVINEDRHWMLQGWKGKIIHALSCWKPVQDRD